MKELTNYKDIRTALASLADDEYREFSMRGIPSERPFIGVRIPEVRKIAARVPSRIIPEILTVDPVAIEEVLLRGILIARLPYSEILSYFDSQVNLIDNWCTCDIFASEVAKKARKHREEFYAQKIEGLLESSGEFSIRLGLVLLKCGYVDAEYLHLIFDKIDSLASASEYYIKMALAWLVSECFIKFPEPTLEYLKVSKLPKWTFNKSISKICDSYRVEPETKDHLRKMRK